MLRIDADALAGELLLPKSFGRGMDPFLLSYKLLVHSLAPSLVVYRLVHAPVIWSDIHIVSARKLGSTPSQRASHFEMLISDGPLENRHFFSFCSYHLVSFVDPQGVSNGHHRVCSSGGIEYAHSV